MSDNAEVRTGGTPDWAAHANAPANADSLTSLAGVRPAELNGPELIDAIVASEKALSLLAGTQMRLLAALAVPFVAGDPMRLAARLARKNCSTSDDSAERIEHLVPDAAISLASAEVAAALRISPVTAGIRVREAGTMTTVLAPTLVALEDGLLDRAKARVIAEHCEPLVPVDKVAVQDLVLPQAKELTTSELRDITGQAVVTVDPDGCDERHKAAAARRDLALKALPDAMAMLRAILPADAAVKIFQLSDLLATATAGAKGDGRGIGARRIDALVDVSDQLLTHGFLDLSHYLGNPLPDHGTPREPVSDAACPVDDHRGLVPEPDGTSGTRAETGNENSNARADATDHSDSDAGHRDSNPDADAADHSDSSAGPTGHTDSAGPTEHTGSSANAADQNGVGAGEARNLTTNRIEDPRDVASEEVRRVADATDPSITGIGQGRRHRATDESSVAVTPTHATVRTETAQGTNRGSDGPCAACGSTWRSERSLTRQGRRPHLSVTVGLGTLAGLDNLPGKLAGFGAIPPGLARSIAASAATITTALIDPETGRITRAGALTYRPRQELRDQIASVFETCQFPSCRQPVWRCDIDHRDPFDHANPEQGGQTTPENTGPYCRRHHLFKHHTEWRTHPDVDSSTVIWISPTGHRYAKRRSQMTPPDIWVTTAATMLAERLDNMTASADAPGVAPREDSATEELLTAMLLRQQLNRPPTEYDPEPATSGPELPGNPTGAGQHEEFWSTPEDPPPF